MAKVTMKDVAGVMGVSVMTVSNAFNRPDQLSEDLRRRILARAEKMGYAGPSAAARALRQGRANAFGVVFADSLAYAFRDPFTVAWLEGFSAAMEPTRSSVVLMTVPADDLAGADAVQNTSIDGLATTCAVHPVTEAARRHGIPVVAGDPVGDCWVSIDEFAAGLEVARHLRNLGHERVCVLSGGFGDDTREHLPLADYVERVGIDPIDGWRRLAGILAGLEGADVHVLQSGRWDRSDGEAAAGLALDRAERPTAVVALSDNLALGLLDAMAARGLRAGVDVSVTGFDDVAAAADAGLTTVRQPIREKGRRSAELLLDPTLPRQVTLPHELVVRASTGPAPTRRTP